MEATESRGVRVGSEEGELVRIGGFGTRIRVPAGLTNGTATIVEHTLEPGLLGAPLHRHTREDETSYVLEGVLTAQLGERIVTAGPGDVVVKPRGELHTFWNAGEAPLRFVEVISPGGFEDYFAELARIVPAAGPPDMDALQALAARYGMELDLGSIPRLVQAHGLRLG